MDVFCGIDWAEDHHDIALADRDGKLLARRRISDDAAGLALLLGLLTEHGDSADDPVPVAIETPRGLLTACLRATGRKVYPINPMAVARYRDRHSVAGRKSDHGDAVCWRISCAPTGMPTGRCRPTPNSRRRSRCWPAPRRRRLGAHRRAQQAPLPPARVLSRLPGRLRRCPRRHHPPPGPGHSGRRACPRRWRSADAHPAAGPAEKGRAAPQHRRRSRPAARDAPRTPDAPAAARRRCDGPPGPGPAAPARCRLRGCR